MSHYGECRAMAAKSTKARCLQSWLSGNAVRQSLSHFPATCSKAIMVGETSRIFSGLASESMSNILCRNDETGHLHFHPSFFQVARAASRFLTLTWFTFITIYGFNFNVECSSYTYDFLALSFTLGSQVSFQVKGIQLLLKGKVTANSHLTGDFSRLIAVKALIGNFPFISKLKCKPQSLGTLFLS